MPETFEDPLERAKLGLVALFNDSAAELAAVPAEERDRRGLAPVHAPATWDV